MNRRDTLLALLALGAGPLGAEAQQAARKLPRVGYLSAGFDSPLVAAFRQGLGELGYVERQNIVVEYRFAEGKNEKLLGFAAELLRLNIDVLVTVGTSANRAAQQATQTIPIVMALSGEVAGSGGIASLARPGGNVTGLTTITAEISGKRLALLKEVLPRLSRVALLRNPSNPISAMQLRELEMAARALGLQTQVLEARSSQEFERAFDAATRARADALVVLPDLLFFDNRKRLAELAVKHRLPTTHQAREHPQAGALMSYGADVFAMSRRAATYVDKILKGAKAADLPIEQPTKFDLVLNLRTAKKLGLTIPRDFLARVDEVIE